VLYLVGLIWNNILQMIVFVVILKIFAQKLPAVKKSYKVAKWLVLAFSLLNLGVFFLSIFGKRKFGLCKKDFPNSLGGLAIKGLLLLFDVAIFIWRCCNWGIKEEGNENEESVNGELKLFK
jgi:hypothetical protein